MLRFMGLQDPTGARKEGSGMQEGGTAFPSIEERDLAELGCNTSAVWGQHPAFLHPASPCSTYVSFFSNPSELVGPASLPPWTLSDSDSRISPTGSPSTDFTAHGESLGDRHLRTLQISYEAVQGCLRRGVRASGPSQERTGESGPLSAPLSPPLRLLGAGCLGPSLSAVVAGQRS